MNTDNTLPPADDPEANNTAGAGCMARLVRLPVSSVIQRGDKFLSDDGHYLEIDNLGRMLGVRCLGQKLRKEGSWFRETNAKLSHPLPRAEVSNTNQKSNHE